MSTTTSHTSESEEQPESPVGAGGMATRPARLIQNEATTEIPVHLLFRDEPDPESVPVPLKPAVVGRRQGTGEQPRLRRPVPARSRTLPQVDPELVERPARVLPGLAGVLAGAGGVAGCLATSWWAGVLPPLAVAALRLPACTGASLGPAQWAAYTGAGALGVLGFGGLARGRTGQARLLGLFGRYRGTVRRTGLLWVNPLLVRRRVDVRLRHWRSEAMPAADANGVALRVVVQVVWRVRDTARAVLGIEDHETYLQECVEAALARVPVDLPGSARGGVAAAGEALTRLVAAEAGPIGLEVFSVQPLRVEYAPEIAAAMHRRTIAALDARQRASMLNSVVDSVEDTVTRLTMRGLVELDDYERKVLVRDLTVAFCSGRREPM
ncbi:SPFH domain-containing protein [Streptomyces sp. Ag109_G2-15]|uniref:SPFH domain-containing protein n=1 Tax=Streptomyces sp. Ag109_G2-15 TaxID=1938850 RepID=UPI000BC64061|nr:SPFH domain-containing protein [Streptomyces sp. Ag109_G2-15]SOD86342.1 SPFH domain / Band 7 family protein [Streptomyces sp. Ag109_G2-15]